jgi:hypothetical protein
MNITTPRWWLQERWSPAMAGSVRDTCRQIAESERWRTQDMLTSWRLYDGRKWASLRRMGRQRRWNETPDSLVRYNLVKTITDTVVAKLVKSLPAPEFVTNGADYKIRRATKKRNKFCKGALHASGFYKQLSELVKAGALCGTHAVKFVVRGKEIACERVLMWELFVPPWEVERGEPRTLYQRTLVDRQALRDRFGTGEGKAKRLAAINTSAKIEVMASDPSVGTYDVDMAGGDMVEVIEAWHLGDCDEDGKRAAGRHAVVVEGGVLCDEEWKHARFPFAFFTWEEPPAGWWGRGIALQLYGLQFEVNDLLQNIAQNTRFHATPTTFMDAQSAVMAEQLTNDVGNVVKMPPGASPPIRLVTPIMPAEVYGQVAERIRMGYEVIGISQLSANSQKPAGLDAGVALREFHDIESERFIVPGRRVEDAVIQAAYVCIDLAREIPGYMVDTMDRRGNKRIAWKDLKLAEEDFTLQCFPVAMLPQTPAARKQAVEEYMRAGMISPEKARDLLDMPDLEEDATLVSASLDFVRLQVDRILDEEDYEMPDPRLDLNQALPYATAQYFVERANGCPEEILEELRRYLSVMTDYAAKAAQASAQQAAPQQVPQAMQTGMAPPAMPTA